ncbi:hypothetical protein CLI64_10995 [Nostoc sp. CENA543]|uniref:hypothetical protein n=1 Tax=Nostoc sp. CENA543 TaxID=1869241 RepID=UPI000CA36830|nr:hypothetical protein [Nostoc sp. CENA543]AUT00880.1 hypothetical protein CLI64_10995 [Nostoc sp. CENA543]
MKIREAAELIQLTTGQELKPKQLLVELQTRFPNMEFTLDSDVPEEFVERTEALANKVKDSKPNDQPKPSAGGMGMGLAKTSAEAITNTKATALSITECIREALEDAELVLAIQQGFRDALVIEDAYQTAKNQALGAMVDSRSAAVEQEVERLRAENEAFLIDRAAREQERLGEWVRRREASRQLLQQVKDDLSNLISLL